VPYETQPQIELTPEQKILSELMGKIEAEIRVASHNAMEHDQNEKIIFHDQSNRYYEYIMSPDEALAVDKALWTTGGDMTIEVLQKKILGRLEEQGFDLSTTILEAPEEPNPHREVA
jgi:hypothetical protein